MNNIEKYGQFIEIDYYTDISYQSQIFNYEFKKTSSAQIKEGLDFVEKINNPPPINNITYANIQNTKNKNSTLRKHNKKLSCLLFIYLYICLYEVILIRYDLK